LKTNGGAYQPEEWLEEIGNMPTQEVLTEANMSEEEDEKIDEETGGLESLEKWKLNSIKGDKESMGDQVYLSTNKYGKKEVQLRRLHKKS
jgi:hypothetical protein